jgi:HEAT repeat protein
MAQPELPTVLAAALSIDNELRRQAEARLAVLCKDPAVVPALLQLLQGAPDESVRHLAAITLRKRIATHWLKLPEATRTALKGALLDAIVREPRCAARRARGA